MKNIKVGSLISWSLIFFSMVVLGMKTTYQSDDYAYHFFYTAKDGYKAEPFDNFIFQIVPSMINHWHTCNGRFFAHTIVQLMMQMPHWVFVTINSLVFVLLIFGIMKLAKLARSPQNIILTGSLIFLLTPIFGQTTLWLSGSINYMWMGVIQIAFVSLFLKWQSRGGLLDVSYIGLLMLAIFVGNSQMHGGPAIFVALTGWALVKQGLHNRLIWKIAVLDLLGVLGFALNYFAEGSRQRVSDTSGGVLTIDHVLNFVNYTKPLWPMMLLGLLIFCIGVKQQGLKKWWYKITSHEVCGLAIVVSGISVIVMFFTTDLVTRTLYPVFVFAMITMVAMLGMLRMNRVLTSVRVIMSIVALIMLLAANVNLNITHEVDAYNVKKMTAANKQDDVELAFNYVPNIQSKTFAGVAYLYNPMTGLYRLSDHPDGWVNRWAARYYNVKSVKVANILEP